MVFAAASAVLADPPAAKAVGEKCGLALPSLLAVLVGMMALFSMIPEGAVLDWSALYLQQELGASVEAAGFAFAAFSATMAVMRFSGDAIRDRLGAVLTLRLLTVVAGTGLLTAAFAGSVPVAALGFALAGLGIANMVPIAFSAAGNLPGLAAGVGISAVSFMGYSGLLFAPSLIGFIAKHTGLGPIYAGPAPAIYSSASAFGAGAARRSGQVLRCRCGHAGAAGGVNEKTGARRVRAVLTRPNDPPRFRALWEGFAPSANSLELAVTTRASRPSPLEFRRDGNRWRSRTRHFWHCVRWACAGPETRTDRRG